MLRRRGRPAPVPPPGGPAEPAAAPAEDTAVAFGRELRRLRAASGLSQRAFTKLLGLSAHSNIADYESGRRVPPRDIVLECQRLLAADTLLPLHAAALAQRMPPEPPPHRPAAETVPHRSRHSRHLVTAVLAAAATVLATLGWLRFDAAPDATAIFAPSSPSTWDGNDPKAAGCADDAVSLDAEPVRLPGGVQIGTASLRYSPRCTAAWAKFEPLPQKNLTGDVMVVVEAVRPADGIKTVFHYPSFAQVYGDLLLTAQGCVRATATVTFPDGRTATGATSCLSPP